MSKEQVFTEALSLPTNVRAELAQKLLVSLDDEAGSPEIEAAWRDEVVDRCKAYDEGKIGDRDEASVLREAYRKVK
jgi:putative addiction module component (TIGR02574 family)